MIYNFAVSMILIDIKHILINRFCIHVRRHRFDIHITSIALK